MIKLKESPVDGVAINLGGFSLIVPSLNLRQIKALTPDIKKMEAEKDQAKLFTAQVKIIREALRRNYPEITAEEIEDIVDMNTVEEVILAVMGQKKAEVVTGGKATPAGE